MIKEITIRNYKSIHDLTMELGNVNVLIGENGCGKTNILEAVAMYGAATNNALSSERLTSMGIRVTKPSLSVSSFSGRKQRNEIQLRILDQMSNSDSIILFPANLDDIYSEWKVRSVLSEGITDVVLGKMKELEASLSTLQALYGSPDSKNQGKIKWDFPEGEKAIPVLKIASRMQLEIEKLLEVNSFYSRYLVFNLDAQALRGISAISRNQPLGICGEGLDILLSDFSKEEWEELLGYSHLISWLENIIIDQGDKLKFKGHKLGRSNSILYFQDKFMRKSNNVFAAENSNEGILHVLFYLALFISKKTPKFFAIDNIETALNPKLCRTLMKEIAALAVKHDKQVLITTHNPAILDGINLHDDTQRLFVVSRNDDGHTKAERIRMKPQVPGKELKLSEMWMRGSLGGLPTNF